MNGLTSFFKKQKLITVKLKHLLNLFSVRREMDHEVETMQQTIGDLEAASDPLYLPDPDPTKFPVQRHLTRKAGYLNARK